MKINLMYTFAPVLLSVERYHAVVKLPPLRNQRPFHTAGWEGSCALLTLKTITAPIEASIR